MTPGTPATPTHGNTAMSNTTSLGSLPSQSLFGRLKTLIETALDRVALIAARNGDVPPFGL